MNEKMRSHVMGLIMGQFSSPLPISQKEPVAYLYNGVRLPKLPESDLPYACIVVSEYYNNPTPGMLAAIVCFYNKVGYLSDRTDGYVLMVPEYTVWEEYHLVSENLNAWEYGFGETTGEYGRGIIDVGSSDEIVHPWTNIDLCDYSGQVLYNKSADPIPVYE